MQGAERNAIVRVVRAARLTHRQNMCRVQKAKLHATNCAAIPVGIEHLSPELHIAPTVSVGDSVVGGGDRGGGAMPAGRGGPP